MDSPPVILPVSPEEFQQLHLECMEVEAGRPFGPMLQRIAAWRYRMGLLPQEIIHVTVVREDGRPLYP